MITETYFDDTINDSENFPNNYIVYRLDRNRHGGGVLIAVFDTLSSVACPQYNRDNILECSGKPVLFSVFYQPPNSPDSNLLELQYSLSLLP